MKSLRNKAYQLLRRSEAFFKTDMVYLAKGGTVLTVGQVITSLASFLLALIFARYVPKESYGNYRYIISLAGLAATFTLTGLSSGVLQSVARGYSGTFIESVKISIKWNLWILVAASIGSVYYLAHGNTTIGISLIVVALLYPVIKTLEIYESFLAGKKVFGKNALYRGIADVGTYVATAIGIVFTKDVILLISINLLAQVILDAIFFNKVYRSIPDEEKTKIEHDVITFSKHLSIQNVLSNLAGNLDKIIIFHYLGATAVATYTFAIALPQQVRGLVANFATLTTPKVATRTPKEAVSMIPKRYYTSLLVVGPIIVLYIIFAPILFKILFPLYIDAVPYTRLYVLVLLILGNLSGLVLTTQKATHEQYILTLFSSSSQIVLMILLVNKFGLFGIIWAILLSKFSTSILSYILAKRFAARHHLYNN